MFVVLVPLSVGSVVSRYGPAIVYCDDSLPFYPYFVKKLSGARVVARLGDLQTGYHLLKTRSRSGRALFRLVHFLEKNIWKGLDGLIPISKTFGRYVRAVGVDDSRIVVVPESVDTHSFRPLEPNTALRKRWSLAATDRVLMFHGTVEPLKGLDSLLELSADCLLSSTNTKLVIVGDGSAKRSVLRLADKLGIADRVICTGWVPYDMIPEVIALCDVGIPMRSHNPANDFVLTSAMLQYWACGKPVLAPALKEMERVIDQAGCGLLFDFGDKPGFHRKLNQLLENRELQRSMAKIGREIVADKYDSATVGKELAKAIASFAADASSR